MAGAHPKLRLHFDSAFAITARWAACGRLQDLDQHARALQALAGKQHDCTSRAGVESSANPLTQLSLLHAGIVWFLMFIHGCGSATAPRYSWSAKYAGSTLGQQV